MVWSFSFYSLLFSFIIFYYLWTKTAVKPLNSKKKSWRKNSEKVCKSVEKCQKVWKSAETILPFSCCPLVFLWPYCVKTKIRKRGGESRNPWVIKFHARLGCWFISLQLRDHSFPCRKKQFYHLVTSQPPIWQPAFWNSISLELRDPWNGGAFRNAPKNIEEGDPIHHTIDQTKRKTVATAEQSYGGPSTQNHKWQWRLNLQRGRKTVWWGKRLRNAAALSHLR